MLKNLKKRLKDQRGLTLIELLAVIVILGIIAAIAIPSIGGIIQKSRIDAVKSDAIQVINAAKTYVASEGIPESGEVSATELAPFVDGGTITTDYTVEVTHSGNTTTYLLTTTKAIVAGKKTVTFTDASLSDLKEKSSDNVVIADKK